MEDRELIIVGDRVLILPDSEQDRTETGLFLPQGVKEKEKVQTGVVVKIGPGYPLPNPEDLQAEPWQASKSENKYLPLQAKEGDYCIFLRNAGIELDYQGKKYIVIPHSAILVLLRDNLKI